MELNALGSDRDHIEGSNTASQKAGSGSSRLITVETRSKYRSKSVNTVLGSQQLPKSDLHHQSACASAQVRTILEFENAE